MIGATRLTCLRSPSGGTLEQCPPRRAQSMSWKETAGELPISPEEAHTITPRDGPPTGMNLMAHINSWNHPPNRSSQPRTRSSPSSLLILMPQSKTAFSTKSTTACPDAPMTSSQSTSSAFPSNRTRDPSRFPRTASGPSGCTS